MGVEIKRVGSVVHGQYWKAKIGGSSFRITKGRDYNGFRIYRIDERKPDGTWHKHRRQFDYIKQVKQYLSAGKFEYKEQEAGE